MSAKLLTRLQLSFSYLTEQKLRHDFEDAPAPMCTKSQKALKLK